MEKFNDLKKIIKNIEADAEKFYKNANSAAGTRLRKAMQEIKNLTTEIRSGVTEIKKKAVLEKTA